MQGDNNQHTGYIKSFEDTFLSEPDRICIESFDSKGSLTYFSCNDVFNMTKRTLNFFTEHGLKSGDRAAIISPANVKYGIAYFALAYGGITGVFIDSTLPVAEINRLVNESDVRGIITYDAVYDALDSSITTFIPVFNIFSYFDLFNPDYLGAQSTADPEYDVTVIIYSSGTTSRAKGIMITYNSMLLLVDIWHEQIDINENTRYLHVLPFCHIAGFASFFSVLFTHGTVGIVERINSIKLAKAFQEFAPTATALVPKIYDAFIDSIIGEVHKKNILIRTSFSALLNLSGLFRKYLHLNIGRTLFKGIRSKAFGPAFIQAGTGAAALSKDTADFMLNIGLDVVNMYASTETNVPIACTTKSDNYPDSYVGRIKRNPNIDIRIDELTGEILVKTKLIMKGYFREPKLTHDAFKGDYFKTGDLGYINSKGGLVLSGRMKESILLHTGKKVSPIDVENLYKDIVGNHSYACCGIPCSDGNYDYIYMFIEKGSMDDDEMELLKNELMNFSNMTGVSFKLRHIHFIDALPLTSLGKVKRFELKDMLDEPLTSLTKQTSSDTSSEYSKAAFKKLPVEDKVIRIIKDICKNNNIVTDVDIHSSLVNALSFDSLMMLDLTVSIESVFNMDIGDFITSDITVRDIILLINNHPTVTKRYDINDYPKQKSPLHLLVLRIMTHLSKLLWHFDIEGLENIPKDTNYIICPNHQTHLDGLWTLSFLPGKAAKRFKCLAKQEHLDKGISRFGLKMLGGIPVERSGNSAPAMKKALECLTKENSIVLIHPEGTRTRDDKMHHFKPGAAKLAIDSNTCIIPVKMQGASKVYPPGTKLPKLGLLRHHKDYSIKITYGKPIYPDTKDPRELTNILENTIRKM